MKLFKVKDSSKTIKKHLTKKDAASSKSISAGDKILESMKCLTAIINFIRSVLLIY